MANNEFKNCLKSASVQVKGFKPITLLRLTMTLPSMKLHCNLNSNFSMYIDSRNMHQCTFTRLPLDHMGSQNQKLKITLVIKSAFPFNCSWSWSLAFISRNGKDMLIIRQPLSWWNWSIQMIRERRRRRKRRKNIINIHFRLIPTMHYYGRLYFWSFGANGRCHLVLQKYS